MAGYSKASVARPSGMPGAGLHPMDQLILIDVDDIASFPEREADGVNISSSNALTLKTGAKAIAIYMTPGTTEVTSNSEGDADEQGFTPTIQFNHPGNEEAIMLFKTNWLSRNAVAILKFCDSDKVWLAGSPCNPMKLTANYTGNGTSNRNQLTFAQASKGLDFALYAAALPALDTDS